MAPANPRSVERLSKNREHRATKSPAAKVMPRWKDLTSWRAATGGGKESKVKLASARNKRALRGRTPHAKIDNGHTHGADLHAQFPVEGHARGGPEGDRLLVRGGRHDGGRHLVVFCLRISMMVTGDPSRAWMCKGMDSMLPPKEADYDEVFCFKER